MANAIHFSEAYLAGLSAAIDNFWLVSKAAAQQFAEDHDRTVQQLAEFPGLGERLPRSRYSVPISKHGYRIIYRVQGEAVTLLHLENVGRRRR